MKKLVYSMITVLMTAMCLNVTAGAASADNNNYLFGADGFTLLLIAAGVLALLCITGIIIGIKALGRIRELNNIIDGCREAADNIIQQSGTTQNGIENIEKRLAETLSLLLEKQAEKEQQSIEEYAQAVPQIPVQPERELTFAEKYNIAVNSGTGITGLGLQPVELSNNAFIEIKPVSADTAFFYSRDVGGNNAEIYPDAKIREIPWGNKYSPWFDITRLASAASRVVLLEPALFYHNLSSGKIELTKKGRIEIQ